jgi:hypothetical protein
MKAYETLNSWASEKVASLAPSSDETPNVHLSGLKDTLDMQSLYANIPESLGHSQ